MQMQMHFLNLLLAHYEIHTEIIKETVVCILNGAHGLAMFLQPKTIIHYYCTFPSLNQPWHKLAKSVKGP